MQSREVYEKIKDIRNFVQKAQFQRALTSFDKLSQLLADKELDSSIIMLSARYNSEFKEYINGTKSSRVDFNKIILAMTHVLNEATDLADYKFRDEAKVDSRDDLIEKISLESDFFHKAIKGLNLSEERKDALLNAVGSMEYEISKSQGKRILWIDDKPHKIIGERRFFRSLGVEIVTGHTQEAILQILEQDGDFDLLISDIQWRTAGGGVTYGGLNAVKEIRNSYQDSFIGKLKVIFYTGYREDQIQIIDQQAGIRQIENSSIIFSIDQLITEAFSTLAASSNLVNLGQKKTPT